MTVAVRRAAQLRLALLRGRPGRERRADLESACGAMDSLNLNLCESLYTAGTATAAVLGLPPRPEDRARRELPGTAGRGPVGHRLRARGGQLSRTPTTARCSSPTTRASASGRCAPTPTACPTRRPSEAFAQAANFPVDLEFGPNGELFYPDIAARQRADGSASRATPATPRPPRSRRRRRSPANLPLQVDFDGSESSDPDAGDVLTYAWDLDDDGQLDDSTSASPSFTYTTAGVYTVTLRVTDTERRVRRGHGHDQRRQRAARRPPSTRRRRARPGAWGRRSPSPAPPPIPRTARCRARRSTGS